MAVEDIRKQIKDLEDELAKTKYNKRTQHHIGLVKAKIAKLKEKVEQRSSSKGPVGKAYSVKKSGDATVALLGFPSVGKSTLLNSLTNANSEVGEYEFTTLDVIPGLLNYNHAQIQILDLPGIVKGAASGRGRGKEIISVLRNADLILIVVDVFNPQHYNVILKEVYDAKIRLNKRRPDVKIKKKSKDGVHILSTVKLDMDRITIESVLKEFKLMNADVLIRDKINVDELIDCIEDNKHYVKGITVLNKIDLASEDLLDKARKKVKPDLMISAKNKENIERLKELIFKSLDLIAIYMKEPGKKADMEEPMIVRKDSTIKDICSLLHRDFINRYRYTRIWGPSAKFDGQIMHRMEHKLNDGDVIEIHLN